MVVAYLAVEKTSFSYDRMFCYMVPENLMEDLKVGSFVLVPFGRANRLKQGIVFSVEEKREDEVALNYKSIIKILSDEVLLTENLLAIAKFMHSSYFCSWYDTIRAILPTGFFYGFKVSWKLQNLDKSILSDEEEKIFLILQKLKNKSELNAKIKKFMSDSNYRKILEGLIRKKILVSVSEIKRKIKNKNILMVDFKKNFSSNLKLTKKQKILLDYIKKEGKLPLKKACYYCGVTEIVAKNLFKMGLISIFEQEVYKNPYKEVKKTRSVEEIVLNLEQEAAKEGILNLIKKEEYDVALLKGVTGSGKTQIFFKLIDYVLKSGKDCILLVPEISLTTQLLKNLQCFFGEEVAVLHSGISASEQIGEYLRIKRGYAKLIVGTRSAIFAPCENLGLVIMDEEEGACYKNSDMSPRYDAKDVAKFRCFKSNCVLLLASATPSITTNYLAEKGVYKKFVLKNRYGKIELPKVFVVNMLKAKMSEIEGISSYLFEEISLNLQKKEQTILFLNRRGYYLNVFCLDCGLGLKCENCSALMIYHKANGNFMCHHCGAVKENVKICSSCSSKRLVFCGQGTQKIEDKIKKKFSNAKILRLDADTTFLRSDLEEKIKQFEEGKYDILVGTQIVAKGLNFPNVTLVGVLSIDGILFGADYKSSERAFSLLTQVVGRSGRNKKGGRAVIQTANSNSKIISWAAQQNYDLFYENEIYERKEFFCPPFCDLCIVNFIGSDEKRVLVCAKEFILECKKRADVSIAFKLLGIYTPCVEMVNKKHRKRIIIKCHNNKRFRKWMRTVALKVFSSKNFVAVRANIDINGDIL